MARLRPARTFRDSNSQAWARYSLRKPRKNYIKAMPRNHIQVFKTGTDKGIFDLVMTLNADRYMQLRSNSIEAARETANKYLSNLLPENYLLRVLIYPHNVIREHKLGGFAGADRTSRGMNMAFGKPIAVAARIKKDQPIMLVKTTSANKAAAHEALRKASTKLSGKCKIKVA